MSTKTKDSHNSPDGSSRTKKRVKEASTSGSNPTRSLSGFDLGEAMTGSMRNENIQKIISIQNKSLKNFARTNELLGKFNDFSSSKYDVLQHMFLQHTRLLVDLKKGLSSIFLRIRHLKVRLQKQYPQAFDATFNLRQDLEDRLEQEEASKPTYVSNREGKSTDKEKAKTENVEDDKGTIEINNVLGLEESQNSRLRNEPGKTNNDLGYDEGRVTHRAESCATDKTEFSEDVENRSVTSDQDTDRDGEGVVKDGNCENSNCLQVKVMNEENYVEGKTIENVEEGNQDNDVVEGAKVITEGIQDSLVIDGGTEDKR